jgi:hypothetical protein
MTDIKKLSVLKMLCETGSEFSNSENKLSDHKLTLYESRISHSIVTQISYHKRLAVCWTASIRIHCNKSIQAALFSCHIPEDITLLLTAVRTTHITK